MDSGLPAGVIGFFIIVIFIAMCGEVCNKVTRPTQVTEEAPARRVTDSPAYTSRSTETLYPQTETSSTKGKINLNAVETYNPLTKAASTKDRANFTAVVMTVNNNGLYMKSKKSLDSSSIVFVAEGTEVTILYYDQEQMKIDGKVGRWCRVSYDDYEGWAWGWYLKVR